MNVANTAQITVQIAIEPKAVAQVLAPPSAPVLANISAKLLKPTQSTRFAGGIWFGVL